MKVTISFKKSDRRVHRRALLAVVGVSLLVALAASSLAAESLPAAAILQDLRSFREMGSVLYIAAHPDDENTQLIAYLARGRHYRTAYLSVTRGDGGQNVLGPEFDEELGVIRTQELLAARRIDSGRQFFTRAIDFGFSKNYRETLSIWDRQQVLSDMVRVIREFRPDVLITRFSPQPGNTHGHHTASAVLAIEAFKLAGDPKAFPEQLGDLTPWQPKRVLLNAGGFGRGGGGGGSNAVGVIQIEAGGNDPVSGESFAEIAGRSRAMHKTQGLGNFGGGGRGGGGPRLESFQLLGGEPATNDILDGVDTTWGRVSGGAEMGKLTDEVITKFNPQDLVASVPALLTLRSRLTALTTKDPVVIEKRAQLDRILQACLGLEVKTVIPQAEVVPGEVLKLHHSVIVRSSIPVRWLAVRYPNIKNMSEDSKSMELRRDQAAIREATQTLPANTPLTQPYWLREEHTTGMFRVDDPSLIGRPENPPAFPLEEVFEVGGQTLVIPDEPVEVTTDPTKGEIDRRLDVIAPVSLKFASDVRLFAPGAARPVEVDVTAFRADTAGTLQLEAPAGWKVTPATQSFRLKAIGDRARFTFTVTAPQQPATAGITARAEIKGARFSSRRVEIRYDHIPVQLLQPPARVKAVSLDLAIRGRQVGYLPGAGDSVAEGLEQMGYTVTQLTGADLTPERLKNFDAVVIGIRAFNTRTDLGPQMTNLFAYVDAGGNVIVQYNRPNGLQVDKLAPFDLRLSGARVTDENAPVTFLAPDHPALNAPNKITSADFEGWVQERGLYFPNQWDEHFTPIIACSDPGEVPLKGGLLVAKYGKGYFVYTGLAFFRQLPAGVPGAYRLFANLVSLGK
ncbi:MAG: PIG-L family deacetylase [Verrucomicrobiia bacterium]|jgi:LmbE family N-acetylglucosaminyl deacetylase